MILNVILLLVAIPSLRYVEVKLFTRHYCPPLGWRVTPQIKSWIGKVHERPVIVLTWKNQLRLPFSRVFLEDTIWWLNKSGSSYSKTHNLGCLMVTWIPFQINTVLGPVQDQMNIDHFLQKSICIVEWQMRMIM